jgi:hypothetical protein
LPHPWLKPLCDTFFSEDMIFGPSDRLDQDAPAGELAGEIESSVLGDHYGSFNNRRSLHRHQHNRSLRSLLLLRRSKCLRHRNHRQIRKSYNRAFFTPQLAFHG